MKVPQISVQIGQIWYNRVTGYYGVIEKIHTEKRRLVHVDYNRTFISMRVYADSPYSVWFFSYALKHWELANLTLLEKFIAKIP